MDLISIIIPVYNVEAYLNDCLTSIAAQSYPHFEVIMVDDGSTDTSGQICQTYSDKDPRFKVIRQANAGAANAKNAGLDAAQGEYIAFIDSDDWVEPDWLKKMITTAKKTNADVVECSFLTEFTNRSEPGNDVNTFGAAQFTTEDYLRHYLQLWTCALFWNKLFKASLLSNIRFRKERRCIDDEFFTYKAVSGANKVVRISDCLYHYRQRRSSVMQKEETLLQRTADSIDILAERYQWISLRYPGLVMDYLRHDVDTLLYFATAYPFHEKAIASFRKTAKFYVTECFRHYPGKLTLYYALKARFFQRKAFRCASSCQLPDKDLASYYP